MDPAEAEALRKTHVTFMKDLDPRYIIDYLYQEKAISFEDFENITEARERGESRRDNVRRMIHILHDRPAQCEPFQVFLQALQEENASIATILQNNLHAIKSKQGKKKTWTLEKRDINENCKDNFSKNNTIICHKNKLPFSSLSTSVQIEGEHVADKKYERVSSKYKNKYLSKAISKRARCLWANEEQIIPQVLPASNNYTKYNVMYRKIFDHLSDLLNNGHYDSFQKQKALIKAKFSYNADVMCILLYLKACFYMFQGHIELIESALDEAMMFVPKTSNPSKYLVEILSLKCWLALKEGSLAVLEKCLTDAMQVIASDPVGCEGKTAGWIYVDAARMLVPLLTGNNVAGLDRLRSVAITYLKRAMDHFLEDDSKDGPYGFYFAASKLASFYLGFGDYMQTTVLKPSLEEVKRAERLLTEIDNGFDDAPMILTMNYTISKSDYFLHKNCMWRSLHYAQQAYSTATELKLPLEMRQCTKRIKLLEHKCRVVPFNPNLHIFNKNEHLFSSSSSKYDESQYSDKRDVMCEAELSQNHGISILNREKVHHIWYTTGWLRHVLRLFLIISVLLFVHEQWN